MQSMKRNMNLICTERLSLRQLTKDDAEFIVELVNEPGFINNIGDRNVRSIEDAEAYIVKGPAASYALNGFGLYRVGLLDTDMPIGICGLVKREGLNSPDIGYAYLERYWRNGYAVEAGKAVIDHAKDALGIEYIVGITSLDNIGSHRVLQKLGFKYSNVISLPGHNAESMLFLPDV